MRTAVHIASKKVFEFIFGIETHFEKDILNHHFENDDKQ